MVKQYEHEAVIARVFWYKNFPSSSYKYVLVPLFSDKITFNFYDILEIVEMGDNFNEKEI